MPYSVEIVIITNSSHTAQARATTFTCQLLDQFVVVLITPNIEDQSLASYVEGYVSDMNEGLKEIPNMKLNDRVLRGLEGMILEGIDEYISTH